MLKLIFEIITRIIFVEIYCNIYLFCLYNMSELIIGGAAHVCKCKWIS